jgi:hypothetical protein
MRKSPEIHQETMLLHRSGQHGEDAPFSSGQQAEDAPFSSMQQRHSIANT